jgi:hypothetical protein
MQVRERESRVAEVKMRAKGLESQVMEMQRKERESREIGEVVAQVHTEYLEEIRQMKDKMEEG